MRKREGQQPLETSHSPTKIRVSPGQVVLYYAFSLCGMGLDFGFFALLRTHMPETIAGGLSFLVASALHFSANRWLNFKSYSRKAATQARTYFAIVAVAEVVTLATIYVVHGVLGYDGLIAKVISTAITLPLGFLGHRFLTFNAGLRAGIRNLIARRRAG